MEYWIYLQLLLGYGCINTRQVIENIKDINSLPTLTNEELYKLGVTEAQLKKRGSHSLEEATKILKQCRENYITVIPYCDRRYPERLKTIENPPVVLYTVGDLPDFDNRLTVAVVGPRDITEYGKQAAFSLSARLALGGALIVSGGAVGGDAFAHHGALTVGEPTVNVTGGGLLSGYLKKNKSLRCDIIKGGGLLISEFVPLYVPRAKASFHLRNRIIAALSHAVVVVEAGEKSGTLITAHKALEYGREVFALVGDAYSMQYKGCNELISDGALPLSSPKELLSHFGEFTVDFGRINSVSNNELKAEYISLINRLERSAQKSKEKPKKANGKSTVIKKPENTPNPQTLSGDCATVFEALGPQEMLTDEIVLKTNLATSNVLSALTMLEIKGFVEALPGSRYRLK